jgi:hypothetical protein
MAKRRSPSAKGSVDFIAEVELVGVPDNEIGRTERKRIVHDLLKQWSLRTRIRGRPRINGRGFEDAA